MTANLVVRALDAVLGSLVDGTDPALHVTEDVAGEDHRPGFRATGRGVESFLKNQRALHSIGARVVRRDLVATRGDNLALVQVLYRVDKDFEVDVLVLCHACAAGLIDRYAVFDASDEEGAFTSLDGAYRAYEGAPFAEILTLADAQRHALMSDDWDAYRSLVSTDVVLVDHRLASLGTVQGLEEVINATRAFFGLVRDRQTWILAIPAIANDRILAEQIGRGTTGEGAEIESHLLRLLVADAGRIVRIELFPGDALDDALARFAQI